MDIKSVQGKQILVRLAETADVLVENYRGGVLDRLGLGYEDVKLVNPRLIYCSLIVFPAIFKLLNLLKTPLFL